MKLVLIVSTATMLAAVRPAAACKILPPCSATLSEGGVIPANAPALGFTTQFLGQDAPLTRAADNSTVGLSIGGDPTYARRALLPLPMTLQPGETYSVAVSNRCLVGDDPTRTITFQTSDAAPLPPTIGTMRVVAQGQRMETVTYPGSAGSCGELRTERVAFTTIAIDYDPSVTPWLPISASGSMVDRPATAMSDYGDAPKEVNLPRSRGHRQRTARVAVGVRHVQETTSFILS